MGSYYILWDYSPIFRWLDYKMVNKFNKVTEELCNLLMKKFQKHYIDFKPTIERDFCDTMISAKLWAKQQNSIKYEHMTDQNLAMTVYNLSYDGADAFYNSFQWLLLFVAYYPSIQTKLRQEISKEIGDQLPGFDDRHRCHYVMAFITESLRFRNPNPFGAIHETMANCNIGNYNIPSGTRVSVALGLISCDPIHWSDSGHDFCPQRFLDADGHYVTTVSSATFIPFGFGRRKCVAISLSLNVLFILLVRLLQSTKNFDIVLNTNTDLSPDPSITFTLSPKEFKISLIPK
ncbi:steroid 17-alpha-hydroxylase/17,20 lyase-like [Oppia nitens]|uniref:steroid 17-alpha-hydroxylase/17,20 lyase-like n=1 Tax=Oppia nitens TaxID=1686743 RepID=UPI0023DB78EC|nr:steroid 17-alpha-hydroxylase/17,20 lyase-like [Oppia nitens]